MEKYERVYAEIDLDAIVHNIREAKKVLFKESEIMPIIKADGYGHGAIPIAKALREEGIHKFGVATIDEAVVLRKNGIEEPILILGYTPNSRLEEVVQYDLTQTVFKFTMAENLSKVAVNKNKIVKIHIKVDTGMGRIGFLPNQESVLVIDKIAHLPNIEIEGIFTHFSKADEKDKSYTNNQLAIFKKFYQDLGDKGINIKIKHASNSAGVIDVKDAHFELVRFGISTYGLYPSDEVDKTQVRLKPALSLISHVIHVKEVEAGVSISYGGTYITEKKSRIATIPVGYGDGYDRLMSSKGRVLINGEYAPIVGRVCMDQFMIDITDIKDAADGDEVILIGKQGENEITADEIASIKGSINYEVVCQLGKRIPRIYKKNQEIIHTIDYF